MIENQKVLAIVPARAGSKGLPGKNIRILNGKPLLAWPIEAANSSLYIDKVVVSTDSCEYAELARVWGAEVPVLRPPELATDNSPSSAFVVHMLDVLSAKGEDYDYIVLLEPTSPLTEAHDIDAAIQSLNDRREAADSLVGVTELVVNHPDFVVRKNEGGVIAPYAAVDFTKLPRRQDIEPLFALDGSIYISSVDSFRKKLSFCHDRTLGHLMPSYKAHEVDSLLDFICIEAILMHKDQISKIN